MWWMQQFWMIESGAEIALKKRISWLYKILCRTHIFQSLNPDSAISCDSTISFTHLTTARCQYLILVYIIYTCKERQNLHVRCENSECYFPNLHVLYANLGLWCCWYVVVFTRFAYVTCKLYKKSLLIITFGHFHLECILLFLLICNLIFCIGHLALWCSLAYLCVIYQSLHWIYGVYWLACKSFQQSFSVFSRTDYN